MGAMGTNQTFEKLGGERKGREGTRLLGTEERSIFACFLFLATRGWNMFVSRGEN